MKHKCYRFLTLLLAALFIAGTVCSIRMLSVHADEETSSEPIYTDPAPTTTEAPPTTPEPTTPEPTTPEPTTPEPSSDPTDPTAPPTEPPHSHSHAEGDPGLVIKEVSCTEDGQIQFTCVVCGEVYYETVPALGHSWGEWVETKAATYEAAGQKTRTCERCGATETQEIPAIPYPEGSIVDVAFTVTGGKFGDGSTQKNVPVIKYENGVPSRNGIGHLKQEQIPTDMIPDEGYADGFWAEPAPSPSVNITANTTFAYSYTGTFNYNGTYTSYNGPWRPTTPQGPTQPRPTQPRPTQPTVPSETDNPTDGENTVPEEGEILIENGEAGEYGELISVGSEQFWAYHLPEGDYIVTNEGSDPANISVFSDDTLVNSEGVQVPAQQYANLVLAGGASSEFVIVLTNDRYVRLSDGAKVRFVLSTEPVESDSETESTEEVTDATEMSTVPVSESPDSSETQPSDGQGRQPMVLWPFIVVLGVLVAGLGVLIFFIVRLLKKSGSEEGEDGEEEEEE